MGNELKSTDSEIGNLLNLDGLKIIQENTKLTEEFIQRFDDHSVSGLLQSMSINSSSYKPVDVFLGRLTTTTEQYFSDIIDREGSNFSFREFFKAFDLSASAKGIVDGVHQDINDSIEMYDVILKNISKKFPEFQFENRYQLPSEFKNFSIIFLSKVFTTFFNDLAYHQTVLKRTIRKYKVHKSEINKLKTQKMALKLAATFLGGVPASLAVHGSYEYLIGQKVIGFEKELLHLFHSWYILQNSNLNQMIEEYYRPRLHYLYLSTITGMLSSIQNELNQFGYKINEIMSEDQILIGLIDGNAKMFTEKLNRFLGNTVSNDLEHDIKIFREFISVLNKIPQINLSFENFYEEVEGNIIIKYIELQSQSLKEFKNISSVLKEVSTSFDDIGLRYSYVNEMKDDDFSYATEILQLLPLEEKKKWVLMYSELIKKNNLHKGKLLNSNIFVLKDNILNNTFLKIYYMMGKTDFVTDRWTYFELNDDKKLIKDLKSRFDTQYAISKMTIIDKLFRKPDAIQTALESGDLFGVENMLSNPNSRLKKLRVDNSLFVHPYDMIFYNIHEEYRKGRLKELLNVKIDTDTLEKIVENDDWSLLQSLLDIGLDPFYIMSESTYLLNYAIMNGSLMMAHVVLSYVSENLIFFKEKLIKMTLNESYVSPYFIVFASGHGHLVETYSNLFNLIPYSIKRNEYNIACTVFDEISLNLMTLSSSFDTRILKIAKDSEVNPIVTLGINHRYHTMAVISETNIEVFKQFYNDRPLLYHFYELGCIGVVDFYYDILDIGEYGGISTDDIEEAIWKTQNRAFLKEMNKMVTGVDAKIEEELKYAKKNGYYVIQNMLEDILKNSNLNNFKKKSSDRN